MPVKPSLIFVDSKRLLLDSKNPRLPESAVKRLESQDAILKFIKKACDLSELVDSISRNGYFQAEPIIVIPEKGSLNDDKEYESYVNDPESLYVVAEGSRRLSAIRLLEEKEEDLSEGLREQFKNLPVLFYPSRNEVQSFLGVRHLAGVRKWNVYERARFVVKLRREDKLSMEEVQVMIGDRCNSAKKNYVCYRLIEMVEEFDENFDTKDSKDKFSHLQLAMGYQDVRDYVGLPNWKGIRDLDDPVPKEKVEKLVFLFKCLFESRGVGSLIRESRDISNKLVPILGDPDATRELEDAENVDSAYEMIGGDVMALKRLSEKARKSLESFNGKLSGIELSKVKSKDGESVTDTINRIERMVRDIKAKMGKEVLKPSISS